MERVNCNKCNQSILKMVACQSEGVYECKNGCLDLREAKKEEEAKRVSEFIKNLKKRNSFVSVNNDELEQTKLYQIEITKEP